MSWIRELSSPPLPEGLHIPEVGVGGRAVWVGVEGGGDVDEGDDGGLVEVGVAMLDGGDNIVPSAILVDNFFVPEPSTAVLLGFGIVGLLGYTRRLTRTQR